MSTSVYLCLLVSEIKSDSLTHWLTDCQCHLLSCPGQLKKGYFAFFQLFLLLFTCYCKKGIIDCITTEFCHAATATPLCLLSSCFLADPPPHLTPLVMTSFMKSRWEWITQSPNKIGVFDLFLYLLRPALWLGPTCGHHKHLFISQPCVCPPPLLLHDAFLSLLYFLMS